MQKSFTVTRLKAILILLIFICVTVIVGLLTWYLRPCADPLSVTATTPSTTSEPSTQNQPWKNLRLPKHVVPLHYDITLFPDFYGNNSEFSGNVSIDIDVSKATKHIMIHIKYMTIKNTRLTDKSSGKHIPIKRTFHYPENQFWVTETTEDIKPSRIVLHLSFNGSLSNGIVGFYKSTYINSDTQEKRALATSKFEPTDARKAFPCFDEPNIKANYTVHLIHQPDYIALSNMPVESNNTLDNGFVKTNFQMSVPMSTYLVCFIVCDFKYKEKKTANGVTFRVYATPDRVEQVQYSLDIGVNITDDYVRYFDLTYPLPKLDMIAIPDFVSGAMEHWGLITYRETNILYNETEASEGNKQRVATVVAHELAHQWFGNIVTMDWWDDLWLNEGFASFMEYKGVANYEKDWDMLEQFIVEDLQSVMVSDSVLNSHPIIVDVKNPNQINEVFDIISYSKGSSVIRMLESFMGTDVFMEGIRNYLKKYEWKNAKTVNLWDSLDAVAPSLDVPSIMDTWTRQMGFPVVTVSVSNSKLRVKQERFLLDPNADNSQAEKSPYGYKWKIPLDYVSSKSNIAQLVWFNDETASFDIPAGLDLDSPNDWIKFNYQQKGFYRVNYPDNLWRKFVKHFQALNSADRSSLIDDALNLARSGKLDYRTAMDLTLAMENETNYLPWESLSSNFGYITHMLEFTEIYGFWRKHIIRIAQSHQEKLGWNSTGGHLDKYLRNVLISLVCGMGEETCLSSARDKFNDWLNNDVYLDPNLRPRVYQFGMRNAGATEWDKVWVKYTTETNPQEKRRLMYALGQVREPWLIKRLLEYSMDEKKVRSQDFFSVIAYTAANPSALTIVWDFIRQKWEVLVDRFKITSRSLGRMVPGIVKNFNTEFQLNQIKDFFAKYPNAGAGERGRKQALETVQANIVWMSRNKKMFDEWLQENYKDGA